MQSSTDMTVHHQWASRPADERFCSLHELGAKLQHDRAISRARVVSSRKIEFAPVATDTTFKGLQVVSETGKLYDPTHWAFGQLCQRAGAPAGYLRTLPAPLAADALNYGFKFARDIEDVGVLFRMNDTNELAAATGPHYGRVWNSEICDMLVQRFGDGVTGDFRVPGEFGHAVKPTKANTTLYASDRDMFVFLADETNRVTLPDRRDGKSGSLARGFYVSNSEVGAGTLQIGMYLFDYACANRILWGVADFKKISIRHSKGAPDRYIEQVVPVIREMAAASAKPIEETLKAAQRQRVDDLSSFLKSKRFTSAEITGAQRAFLADEGRSITTDETSTVWDIVTGLTAYARDIRHQDDRADLERRAGDLLELVKV